MIWDEENMDYDVDKIKVNRYEYRFWIQFTVLIIIGDILLNILIIYLHNVISTPSPSIYVPLYIDWASGNIVLQVTTFFSLFVHKFHNSLIEIRYLVFIYSIVIFVVMFLIINHKKLPPLVKASVGIFIALFFIK